MKCSAPIMIKNPDYQIKGYERMLPVRCGKCEGCLKSRINDWAFRLEQEAKRSLFVHFVTLTYSPKYVPLQPSLLPSLSKKDCQKFLKRLRKMHPDANIKYFICGEYGSRTYRPHYHAIFFNVPERDSFDKAWSYRGQPIGNVHTGDSIDDGAIPYTLKYMYKKGLVPAFDGDDRLPEFRLMSQRLGDNYLSPAVIKWHLTDLKNRQYVRFKCGIKVAMPRYYREKLIALSGKPASIFRNNESVFMTSEDDDYRTLELRVSVKKKVIRKFQKERNQINRKKI